MVLRRLRLLDGLGNDVSQRHADGGSRPALLQATTVRETETETARARAAEQAAEKEARRQAGREASLIGTEGAGGGDGDADGNGAGGGRGGGWAGVWAHRWTWASLRRSVRLLYLGCGLMLAATAALLARQRRRNRISAVARNEVVALHGHSPHASPAAGGRRMAAGRGGGAGGRGGTSYLGLADADAARSAPHSASHSRSQSAAHSQVRGGLPLSPLSHSPAARVVWSPLRGVTARCWLLAVGC